jgi:hypothetical protein
LCIDRARTAAGSTGRGCKNGWCCPTRAHVALILIDGVVDLPNTREMMPNKPDDAFVDPAGVAEIAFQLCRLAFTSISFNRVGFPNVGALDGARTVGRF